MNPRRHRPGARIRVAAIVAATALLAACGKKGPPLPPLVRTPAPPGGFAAERIGDQVQIQFSIPSANTDGTRPANIERVDIWAYTGDLGLTDREVVRYATRIGQIDVKAPRDPDAVIEPDEPVEDIEAPQGDGLDQGAAATFDEAITPETFLLGERPPVRGRREAEPEGPRPLVGAPQRLVRTYVAVSVTTSGRPGSFSNRVEVPLSPAPPPPPRPAVSYDESAVTITWNAPGPPADEGETLAGRWTGTPLRSIAYQVYDTTPNAPPARLTETPVEDGRYRDARVEWGVERCYGVRAVEVVAGVPIESVLSPSTCVMLTDTFPPSAPSGLTAVGTQGAINLIWVASDSPDVAGYVVLRGPSADALEPITPAPITDTNFRDPASAGERRAYAVRAVDRAGNQSPDSNVVEETAR